MRWTLLILCASGLFAQGGTEPKPKPEDYESHGRARDAALGAEFMIHSFEGHGVTYVAPDYLVVEVAIYPPKGTELAVYASGFSLRLNGSKILTPVSTGMVASTLGHPEWRPGLHAEAGAGLPGGEVVLGGPPPPKSIPGQPTPDTTPRPVPGTDQDPMGNGAPPRTPRPTAQELLTETALPEGKFPAPVSGYLYFPYRGKVGSLKTVELLFEDAAVPLR